MAVVLFLEMGRAALVQYGVTLAYLSCLSYISECYSESQLYLYG